jgi:ubiquinone/menaquinone biosynthesis C-methylase UbiE
MNQKEVWDMLADSWTHLRTKPEEEVIEFSKIINRGPILDLGCGNCRNLVPFLERNIDSIGLDFSKNMIKESKKFLRGKKFKPKLIIGDLTCLPFKKGSFLSVICIRTLHHIETRELRIRTLEEMKRVGIKILVSVWRRWQLRFFLQLIKSFFSKHYADVYVNWKYHGKVYKRFYHLYTKEELEEDLKKVGFKIEKTWKDKKGNIWSLASV